MYGKYFEDFKYYSEVYVLIGISVYETDTRHQLESMHSKYLCMAATFHCPCHMPLSLPLLMLLPLPLLRVILNGDSFGRMRGIIRWHVDFAYDKPTSEC